MAELIRKPEVENNFAEAGAANVRRIESIGIPKASGGHEAPVNIVSAEQHEQPQVHVTAESQLPKNAAAFNAQNRLQTTVGRVLHFVYAAASNLDNQVFNGDKTVREFFEAFIEKARITSNPPVPVAA